MGPAISATQINSTKTYPPQSKLTKFPPNISAAPGNLITYFLAKPPSYELPSDIPRDRLYWWTALHFVPFQDNQLFVSVGAYISRQGASSLTASHLLQGLIHNRRFQEKRNGIELLRGSRTSALPNICVHPGGKYILYVDVSTITLMNLDTKKSYNHGKGMRNNNFQHCTVSPNGYHIAYMARTSQKIEIGLLLIETNGLLTPMSYIFCNSICPSCVSDRSYSDRYQCKFSPDSGYVAAATSFGHLLILKRPDLSLLCRVSPGIVEWGVDNMTNERSYDFDPRFNHERVVFGTIKKNVHLCDIAKKTIEESICLDGEIQCIKFAPHGNYFAVACSLGVVHVLNSDNMDAIMKMDGTALPTEAEIEMVNGSLAEAVCMSFSSVSDVLAVSHTDGYVRLWKLPPEINLQSFCKLAVLKCVRMSKVHELPIPNKIKQDMTNNYEL